MRTMTMRVLFFLFLLGGYRSTVTAGEWGSSGGEFIRDQNNPWFVKNTQEVDFCLVTSPEDFSASLENAEKIVKLSLDYWRQQFHSRGELLGIGTQTFRMTTPAGTCLGHEDLQFRLGFGSLTAEQKDFFSTHRQNIQDFVGIAVRTSYDPVRLRGKGFIFISSDRGDASIRNKGIERHLWSHEGLLFGILQHEIGHIFGVSHTDDGFMAAEFPENMVRNFRFFRNIRPVNFFSPLDLYEKCPFGSISLAICSQVSTHDNWQSFEIKTFDEDGISKIIKARTTRRTSVEVHFPVNIFLPSEQQVFLDQRGMRQLKGPARHRVQLIAESFHEAQKQSTFFLLDLNPERIQIHSFDGHELIRFW